MGSYEDRVAKMGPKAGGRVERRREDLEAQIGHSWGLEVNVEGPSERKKDLSHASDAESEQAPAVGRVWPFDPRLQRAVEEEIAQDSSPDRERGLQELGPRVEVVGPENRARDREGSRLQTVDSRHCCQKPQVEKVGELGTSDPNGDRELAASSHHLAEFGFQECEPDLTCCW